MCWPLARLSPLRWCCMSLQPWHTFASTLLADAGLLASLPGKLVKLGISSADQAVAFLEVDTESTLEMLYPEETVDEACLVSLRKAIDRLRGTAFAGKRRRHDIDPRTDDLLFIMEREKAKSAEDRAMGYASRPIDPESRQCRASARGCGVGVAFPSKAEPLEVWRRRRGVVSEG